MLVYTSTPCRLSRTVFVLKHVSALHWKILFSRWSVRWSCQVSWSQWSCWLAATSGCLSFYIHYYTEKAFLINYSYILIKVDVWSKCYLYILKNISFRSFMQFIPPACLHKTSLFLLFPKSYVILCHTILSVLYQVQALWWAYY